MPRSRLLFVLAVLLLLAALVVYLISRSSLAPRLNQFLGRGVPTVTPSPSASSPTPSLTASPVPQQTYTSDRFNLSFSYPQTHQGRPLTIKEENNRLYLYPQGSQPQSGQYLEILQKDPQSDLPSALRNTILANYSADTCPVITYPADNYPSGFTKAQIEVPHTNSDTFNSLTQKSRQCPSPYTTTTGLSHFLYNPSRSDTFLFVHLTQEPYLTSSGQPWQHTLRFN